MPLQQQGYSISKHFFSSFTHIVSGLYGRKSFTPKSKASKVLKFKCDSVCAHSSHTLKPQVSWQLNWKCIRQLFVRQCKSCDIQSFWSLGELSMWNNQARLSFQRGPKRNAAIHLQRLRPAFVLVTALTVLHALMTTEGRPTRSG